MKLQRMEHRKQNSEWIAGSDVDGSLLASKTPRSGPAVGSKSVVQFVTPKILTPEFCFLCSVFRPPSRILRSNFHRFSQIPEKRNPLHRNHCQYGWSHDKTLTKTRLLRSSVSSVQSVVTPLPRSPGSNRHLRLGPPTLVFPNRTQEGTHIFDRFHFADAPDATCALD